MQTSLPSMQDLPARQHYSVSSIHALGKSHNLNSGGSHPSPSYGKQHSHYISSLNSDRKGPHIALTPRDHEQQYEILVSNLYRNEAGNEKAKGQHMHREHLNSRGAHRSSRSRMKTKTTGRERRTDYTSAREREASPGYTPSATNPYYAADPVWRDQGSTQDALARSQAREVRRAPRPRPSHAAKSEANKKRGFHDDSDSAEEGVTLYRHMMKKSHTHRQGEVVHMFPAKEPQLISLSDGQDEGLASLFSIEDIEKAFEVIDKNNDGLIQKDELVDLMEINGMARKEAKTHADGFFRMCDVDDSGSIDFEEFVRDYVRMIIFRVLRMVQTKTLTFIDRDNDGEISRYELEDVLAKNMGRHRAKKEVEGMFREMDADGSGLVSWSELTAWYSAFSRAVRAKRKEMVARNKLLGNVKFDRWGRQTKAWMGDTLTDTVALPDAGREIILHVACSNLPSADRFSDCDPMVALFAHAAKEFLGNSYKVPMNPAHYVGRTEMQGDEPNPTFKVPFHVVLRPELHQYLTFCVFDVTFRQIMVPDKEHPPMNEGDRMGYATVNLRQLLSKVDGEAKLKIRHIGNHRHMESSSITVRLEVPTKPV
jgi:Ca2+-binding EF-hand superfamily protein